MGAIGSFGAALANIGIGKLLSHDQSYSRIFLIAGLVYPVSLALLFVFIPKVRLLTVDNSQV